MAISQHVIWGSLPDTLRGLILENVEQGWRAARSWNDLQNNITNQFRQRLGSHLVLDNVRLSILGVAGSQAEIDIVLGGPTQEELGRFLIQVSGHKTPRHEKELMEFMSASLAGPKSAHRGALVVCSDNQLRLEGKATSFAYCGGPLIRLAAPVLARCNLLGLLVVGLPTPSYNPGMSLTHHQRA